MSAQKKNNEASAHAVMLWDHGEIKDRNLTMVLQMAGYRVHPVDHCEDVLNLSRVSLETGQPFACLIMRVEYLAEALQETMEHDQGRPLPLPVVVLTDSVDSQIPQSIQQQICLDDLHVCSSVALLETLAPLLEAQAAASKAPGECISHS